MKQSSSDARDDLSRHEYFMARRSRSKINTVICSTSSQRCHIKEEFDLQWWSRAGERSSGKRKLDETDS